MQSTLPKEDIVLLGVGHTNAHVLRMWRMQPIRDARLTCVSNFGIATYSGMLPGVLAGDYPAERMEIDLVRLCAANGARFIQGSVNGLDVDNCRLLFENRPPLSFDVLSIGIGSVPTFNGVEQVDDTVVAVKPMQTFLQRLESRLLKAKEQHPERPLRVTVVGGGAAGAEIAFCLPPRVKKLFGTDDLELSIIHAASELVAGTLPGTSKRVQDEFQKRGVNLLLEKRVRRVCCGNVELTDGTTLEADIVLWATGATAPPVLSKLNLPVDDRGFLLTGRNLQSTSGAPIFVVGDTGTIGEEDLPKAGVFAVREGPILWENIARKLSGEPLIDYHPQRKFLKLLNTGDGRAIGEYPFSNSVGISLHNRPMWKLKAFIDGSFMDKYQDYRPMKMAGADLTDEETGAAMRCAGCGGKVAGSVLSRVLSRLEVPSNEHVIIGLDQPDDAAIVQPPGGRAISLTLDFFAAPLDDPYLVGRIAVLNSASDVFALGAKPFAALAMITIPVGKPKPQEELMYQLLAGSLEELNRMGATLVGGHTIEGPQLSIGFTIVADQGEGPPRTKGQLRKGDQLVLTKPLGSGVLLAAHMRAQCRAAWMETLLKTMLASNQAPAELVDEFDIAGLTDVTGFGLAGHLLEMLNASGKDARLNLDSIPILPGAGDLIASGVESTLAPANRNAEMSISLKGNLQNEPAYHVLFDPQTCGGLLLGVAPDRLESFLARIEGLQVNASVVGEVTGEFVARESGATIVVE